ncbi:MAG: hypothetical protein J5546_09225 [Lachnospiraceae bacterium]|nr:hypothetical protein [Lachnospiraceae bacterium]
MTMLDKRIQGQILSIKNLKMVQLYQLFNEGRQIHGIQAFYDNQAISLCEADPGFDVLLDHLAKVYLAESVFSEIVTDEETKAFLEDCRAVRSNGYDAVLEGYEEEKVPLCVQKAYAWQFVLPAVQYVIQKIYERKNISVEFDVCEGHWFTQGVLCGRSGEETKRFPYYFDQIGEEAYSVTVGNVLKNGNVLRMRLSYQKEGVYATFEEHAYSIEGKMTAELDLDEPEVLLRILENGQEAELQGVKCEALSETPSPSAQRFLAKDDAQWEGYLLPWGIKFFYASENGEAASAFVADGKSALVTLGCRSKLLSENPADKTSLGLIAFRLYEREAMEEVHLLHIGAPGSGVYENRYAGKYFLRSKTLEQRMKKDGNDQTRE